MRVAVGLSGGVDSAVAALRLLRAGHAVTGVTMTLGREGEAAELKAAEQLASQLGIGLEVFDLSAPWRREVLDYLRETYLAGRTPNPCIRCNERIKFALLPELALAQTGAERFATGHYARLEAGRLYRGGDRAKDQSYFLYRVPGEILARTWLPLGDATKAQVRAEAVAAGLQVAERGESQDFCGGDALAAVAAADRPGKVVDLSGRVLGEHRGYWHHTPGQRKGLGIGGGRPYYVVATRPATNEVVVAFREAAGCAGLRLGDLAGPVPPPGTPGLAVKVRSGGEPRPVAEWDGERVTLGEPLLGVAPGQSAVFYRGEEVCGGGIIQ